MHKKIYGDSKKEPIRASTWIIVGVAIVFIVGAFIFQAYQDIQKQGFELNQKSKEQQALDAKAQNAELENIKQQINDLNNRPSETIIKEIPQEIPKSNNSDYSAIIAEWQDRIVEVTCVFKEDGGIITAEGSATLAKLTDIDGSIIMVALTNAHVLSNNNYSPDGCVVGIYGKGSRQIDYTYGAFLQGTLEDYGYINLDKATKINETTWEAIASKQMKNCSNSIINIGDKIVVLGYPAIGTEGGITATEGIISGIEKNYYVTSAKIDHGNSGGAAILVKDDCYLGIPTWANPGSIESLARILKYSFVIVN